MASLNRAIGLDVGWFFREGELEAWPSRSEAAVIEDFLQRAVFRGKRLLSDMPQEEQATRLRKNGEAVVGGGGNPDVMGHPAR
jgi:hypothetical protein